MQACPDIALPIFIEFDNPVFGEALGIGWIVDILIEAEVIPVEPQQPGTHGRKPQVTVLGLDHPIDSGETAVGIAEGKLL
ncbi:hypothetical protein N7E02_14155 [Aliirhizobium terrae]|uniref:hypothetical protein n=1 Tax=Terrirhizobium terrae TaxID=2926709 RepID=UPI002576BF1E|nr:hypothetical protein [Rhizobium sp. CC-CFT758]WJH41503.1 hypothetical protein N7E02_14155 [Rhizobium sp. CC-CFT758]